jgi:dTMP kinase
MRVFISLEGIDGSGKSTQAKLLAESLGPDAVLVREPGGTETGERVRELLRDPEVEMEPLAELLLFCAARAQLTVAVIRPALDDGRDVVCDRFTDSTLAYQGAARGLGIELATKLNRMATGGIEPDLTLLIEIDPELGAARGAGGGDRFEDEGLAFQRAVAAAYEGIAIANPERVAVIDGSGAIDDVHEAVMAQVANRRPPAMTGA